MEAFKIILLSIILLSLAACTPSLYKVVNNQDYQTVEQQIQQKKMILINEELLDQAYADSVLYMLNHRQWKQLNRKLTTLTDPYTKDFLLAIASMMQKEYDRAYQLLNHLPDEAFDCQVGILKADCLHELHVEGVNFLDRYQQALDCAANPKIKSIAKTRYRFIKYAY